MSLTPSMLDAMVSAGASAEMIAAVVKASLADEEARKVARRAKDAERQRRSRATRTVTVTPRDDGGQGVTECDAPLMVSPTPPSLKPYNPPSPPTGAQTPTGVQPRRRASRLGKDAKPTETNIADAKKLGLTDEHIAREWPKYVDYFSAAPGQKGLKADWDATWRNWCRRVAETLGLSPPSEAGDAAPGFVIVKPDQPEWEPLARRWRAERNRPDGPPLGPSGGWTFPRDWLDTKIGEAA